MGTGCFVGIYDALGMYIYVCDCSVYPIYCRDIYVYIIAVSLNIW